MLLVVIPFSSTHVEINPMTPRFGCSLRFLFAGLALLPAAAFGAEFMFRANVDGQTIEGRPLSWDATHMLLLARDGQLHQFNPKLAENAVKTGPQFVGYSTAEMKKSLVEEFGKQFDVSSTQHYVVAQPSGGDQWAGRFEDLYNRFGHYFRVRGFELKTPPYPLVAIVYRNQAEYLHAAAASGTPMHPNTLGHYDPSTNRVFLFDAKAKPGSANWSENAETIIHEATHQMAYNTGVHRRFAAASRWLVEGLATMFEAPGVWSERYDHTRADRVNRGRLAGFRDYVAKRRQPGSLSRMLTTDDAFRSDPDGAYAEAWALSFYLCETQPRLYANYLAQTADRPVFSEYSAAERMADFQSIFGSDMKLFEAKFLRYMQDVE
jgi:hypothetical protein